MPRFGVQCSVRVIGGRKSDDVVEFREDVKELAEKGTLCDEYRKLVEVLRGDLNIRELDKDHPARANAGSLEDMAVEESERGPVIVVGRRGSTCSIC